MNLFKKKSKKEVEIEDDFSVKATENTDIFTITEGEPVIEGTLLKSFTFDDNEDLVETCAVPSPPMDSAPININLSNNTIPLADNINPIDHRTSKTKPSGKTPPVDGEVFDMVRSYSLRRSTVRILSKIKAIHNDDNVYLNTIVDEAIRYYYEFLKSNA